MGHYVAHLRTSFGRLIAACGVGSCLMLSGCADGVDLNGKVFDLMGISPSAAEARRFEPQVAERAPLVMPPSSDRLPQPGSGQMPVAQLTQQSWPDDPEARKAREAKEREERHLAYCRGEVQWKEKVLNKESVGAPRSPYGPCPTVIGGINVTQQKD
jgi:hypothetical protein